MTEPLKITKKQLAEIVELHRLWLLAKAGGRRANLADAYLAGAYLTDAYLAGAYLTGANLAGAYLAGANLTGADFTGVHFQICPDVGGFDGWKAVSCGVILRLRIPASAKRTSSIVGRKCRCNKAKVIEAWKGEEKLTEGQWPSKHDPSFVYTMGETAKEPNYDDDIRVECTRGIHFFVTRKEAEEWL